LSRKNSKEERRQPRLPRLIPKQSKEYRQKESGYRRKSRGKSDECLQKTKKKKRSKKNGDVEKHNRYDQRRELFFSYRTPFLSSLQAAPTFYFLTEQSIRP
jgi:hypothetical protein